jgi:alkanesulfonate monooxygenase SsuD/methylene tetrahydromethanopterin reductase-like flavin-dependent oxidoreductase (luciferase family)
LLECADWAAIDHVLELRGKTRANMPDGAFDELRRSTASGLGGLKLVGDPDSIAADLAMLSEKGLAGVALTMIDYLAEMPILRDEILPRLERLGLRQPAKDLEGLNI